MLRDYFGTAHFVASAHFVAPIKCRLGTKCAALDGTLLLRRQKVQCEPGRMSRYDTVHFARDIFFVPHGMESNVHSDIYLINTKETSYYLLVECILCDMYYISVHVRKQK